MCQGTLAPGTFGPEARPTPQAMLILDWQRERYFPHE